ncbi:CDP-glycerol glycerophosphotransferase family protein [Schleiferiaceae bacterium]|nr:CDP-glycerol glycerophosphotransferase family protein [Schleiferiaceae bacterium]
MVLVLATAWSSVPQGLKALGEELEQKIECKVLFRTRSSFLLVRLWRLIEAFWVDGVIVTHDVVDYTWNRFSKAKVINIWHGMPVKPIGYKSDIERKWLDRKGPDYYTGRFDYLLISSKEHLTVFCESWRIDKAKVQLCDSWQSRYLSNDEKSKIIFAPTFGIDNSRAFEAIKDILDIVVCPHPNDLEFIAYLEARNVRFEKFAEIVRIGDVIVTNHSSIVYDFRFTNHVVLLKGFLREQGFKSDNLKDLPEEIYVMDSLEDLRIYSFPKIIDSIEYFPSVPSVIAKILCE